jgi:hypothetical protein
MYTEKEAKEIWNNFADKNNQWNCLDREEKEEIIKSGIGKENKFYKTIMEYSRNSKLK